MTKDIDLYIRGYKADLTGNFDIAFNFDMEDLRSPTAVLNSYSKTVVLEGTDRNNLIFSNLWNVMTVIDSQYNFYDPNKKEPFIIVKNGEKVQEGYVKLDRIDRNGNSVKYSITLYGGLGDFFYNLAYNRDGSKKTLADMDYGHGIDELSTEMGMYDIGEAWNYLSTMNDNPKHNYIYDKMNFAITNDGIPTDNFEANKCMVQMKNNPFGMTPLPSGPSDQYGYFMAEFDKSYSMLETRDIRSKLLRPVFRFKYLFEAASDNKQNGGYMVDLDPAFFNRNNHFYQDAWMTLPNLQEIEKNNAFITREVSFSAGDFMNDADTEVPITFKGGDFEKVRGDLEVPYTLSVSFPGELRSGIVSCDQYYMKNDEAKTKVWYYSRYYVQLVAITPSGTFSSDIHSLHNMRDDVGLTDADFGFVPYQKKPVDERIGKFRYDDASGNYVFDQPLMLRINDIELDSNSRVFLVLRRGWNSSDDSFSFPDLTFYEAQQSAEPIYDEIVEATSVKAIKKFNTFDGDYGKFVQSTIATNISKKKLMSGSNTPLDYLLSYCKMFGLMFIKDEAASSIRIVSRKTYYKECKKVNIDDKIDYSKSFSVYPLSFNNKWMEFSQKVPKTTMAEKYASGGNVEYGQMRVDTNYQFNATAKNLLDKTILKGGVMSSPRSVYNVNTTYNRLPVFNDGATFKVWNIQNELEDGNITHFKPIPSGRFTKIYKDYYFNMPFLDAEKDGREVDVKDTLLFLDLWQETVDVEGKEYRFRVSQDIPEMMKYNEGKSCWLLSDDNSIQVTRVPVFSRFYTYYDSILYTFDMGTSTELFMPDVSYDDKASVYENYWMDFVHDQYLADTRIVECYVLLDGRVMEDYLYKIYFFKNSYWALVSISDYDICANRPTKCKFIKINDFKNYTE